MPTTMIECETCAALQDEVEELREQLANAKRELEVVQLDLRRRREQVEAVAGVLGIIGDERKDLHESDLRALQHTARRSW